MVRDVIIFFEVINRTSDEVQHEVGHHDWSPIPDCKINPKLCPIKPNFGALLVDESLNLYRLFVFEFKFQYFEWLNSAHYQLTDRQGNMLNNLFCFHFEYAIGVNVIDFVLIRPLYWPILANLTVRQSHIDFVRWIFCFSGKILM